MSGFDFRPGQAAKRARAGFEKVRRTRHDNLRLARYSQPECRAGQCKEHFGPMVVTLLAAAALAVWLYLIAGRCGFVLPARRDDGGAAPSAWPAVTAVIPARDEAESVGQTIASLLLQDYPGA